MNRSIRIVLFVFLCLAIFPNSVKMLWIMIKEHSMLKDTYLRDTYFAKWVLRLTLPRAMEYLLNVGINALNNLLTGMYFGEVEMSAISQTASIFAIYEVITYGFASSCSILVAQYWGRRNTDSIKTIISIAVRLECLIGALFSAVMIFIPETVMSFMSTDSAVISLGADYLRVTAPIYLMYGICNALFSSYSAMEMIQYVVAGHSLCSIANLLLSLLLVPRFGVTGAAFSALTARTLSFLFALVVLFRNRNLTYHFADLLGGDRSLLRDFLQVTYPIMGHELIWSIGNNMPQILMGRLGTQATSSFSIALNLCSLLTIIQSGMGNAATTIVGKNIGEGDQERAKKSARTFVIYTFIASAFSSILLFLIHPFYLRFYDLSPEILATANSMMNVLLIQSFFTGFDSIILVSTLRAGGMGKVGFYTDIVVMWMIAIPLAWAGILFWHLSPEWIVLLVKLDMPLKSIVGLYYVLKTDWIHNLTRASSSEDIIQA